MPRSLAGIAPLSSIASPRPNRSAGCAAAKPAGANRSRHKERGSRMVGVSRHGGPGRQSLMVSDLPPAAKHLSRTWSEFVMSLKSLLLAIVAALTIGLAPAHAKPALPPGVEYLPDLVYGTVD